MTGNFIKLKKNLKSFAKRVKDFRYTDRMLITFLLTGHWGLRTTYWPRHWKLKLKSLIKSGK